jgi:hypothetical protein
MPLPGPDFLPPPLPLPLPQPGAERHHYLVVFRDGTTLTVAAASYTHSPTEFVFTYASGRTARRLPSAGVRSVRRVD